ncbi:gamma-glutamylcyclotransferase [Flavobacteriaceae bacterium D16]|nr:gamma-glutamylcyclotransferase [Flavobacteriaceae bacterium D16]
MLERDVRKLVFTRELDGRKDLLSGYRIHRNKVSGLYPSVEATGQDEDQVNGEVFVVSTKDLKRADQYEGEAYTRKRVLLASGTEAWVYQEKSD